MIIYSFIVLFITVVLLICICYNILIINKSLTIDKSLYNGYQNMYVLHSIAKMKTNSYIKDLNKISIKYNLKEVQDLKNTILLESDFTNDSFYHGIDNKIDVNIVVADKNDKFFYLASFVYKK